MMKAVAAPENFFVGGIEGAKYVSEGAKIQKIAENGWFWPFFSSDGGGGQVGAEAPTGGANAPHAPPPLMPPLDERVWFLNVWDANSD